MNERGVTTGHIYEESDPGVLDALLEFDSLHLRAALEDILAHVIGRSADLLSFNEVYEKLKGARSTDRSLKDIPLDAIVGSVGRCTDFTRSFLPRKINDKGRWARVKAAASGLVGLPPIEVYQIDQVYFVLDGHHRVSVARVLEATHIQAYVTEIHTKVPLLPTTQPDDLIHKAEYANFLAYTHLDELHPDVDLSVSTPGQYRILEEQIEIHRQLMSGQQGQEIPYEKAASHWCAEVYLPVVQIIRTSGILQEFPGRTETDFFIRISKHRAALEKALGWEITPKAAVHDWVVWFNPRPQRIVARLGEKLHHTVTPDGLEAGPPPGQWRREQVVTHHDDHLFSDILVLIDDEANSWRVLEQAVEVARREEGRLHGLHVVPSAGQKEAERVQALQEAFDRHCLAANIEGELVIEVGEVERRLCERARWTDLVVVALARPPAPQPLARLSSDFGALIRRCPRPVLAVPGAKSEFRRALLAYDGSPKAQEALYVATYLSSRWNIPLTVVTVLEGDRVVPETSVYARHYLEEHDVQATFLQENGSVAEAILKTAVERETDLIIMGGYGFSPVLEIAFGSTVDQVLREFRKPVLICR